MLRRVFHEQYDVAEDGTITVRDKKLITSDSVQDPNDTDAAYRSKGGKKVKGFATNITETCYEEGKPNLITDVQVKPANKADNTFVKDTYRYFDKTSVERSKVRRQTESIPWDEDPYIGHIAARSSCIRRIDHPKRKILHRPKLTCRLGTGSR